MFLMLSCVYEDRGLVAKGQGLRARNMSLDVDKKRIRLQNACLKRLTVSIIKSNKVSW